METEKKQWCYMADWCPRELQAVGEFARLSLPKLRRIQDCISQQLMTTHNKPDHEFISQLRDDIVWRLQRMDLIIAAAVDKKCF